MFDAERAEFLSFPCFLKATPFAEGADRFVYFEASNESQDLQGEVVLAKALAASADYFKRFGNIDVDHITQIGAKAGIPDYLAYEIGQPVEVRTDAPSTFVKAQLYSGDTPMAAKANEVWDSLTKLVPASRWYPSVGGAIPDGARKQRMDPETHAMRPVVTEVRWTNVGLSRTPVNHTVETVGTVPMGLLAKSWGVAGLEIDLSKGLEAGYDTDSATLTGGAALRKQSLDKKLQVTSFWDFRDRLSDDLRKGAVGKTPADIMRHAQDEYRIDPAKAGLWTENFRAGLARDLSSKRKQS